MNIVIQVIAFLVQILSKAEDVQCVNKSVRKVNFKKRFVNT